LVPRLYLNVLVSCVWNSLKDERDPESSIKFQEDPTVPIVGISSTVKAGISSYVITEFEFCELLVSGVSTTPATHNKQPLLTGVASDKPNRFDRLTSLYGVVTRRHPGSSLSSSTSNFGC